MIQTAKTKRNEARTHKIINDYNSQRITLEIFIDALKFFTKVFQKFLKADNFFPAWFFSGRFTPNYSLVLTEKFMIWIL